METKINIAEILKDKLVNTKLYSPVFGDVYLLNIDTKDIIVKHHGSVATFYHNGELYEYDEAEPLLFPSKEMRDWSKVTWKKGDVLVNSDKDVHVIFEKFEDDAYTKFRGKHYLWEECYDEKEFQLETSAFEKANDDDAQTYINTIEERLDGKINRETLEIENAHPEFKDGDVVYADYGHKQAVFIVSGKTDLSEGYNSFIALDLRGLTLDMGNRMSFFKKDLCKLRLATEEEKKELFDALAKEGKAWDAKRKMIVDLKPKVELKPFDKVLVRDSASDKWRANLFGYIGKDGYYYCVYANWIYCIPYEGNEHLLGTTKDVEG